MGPLIRDKSCSVNEEYFDITEHDYTKIIEEFENEFPYVGDHNDEAEADPLAI